MQKLIFSELDASERRAVTWLADEAGTLTPTILSAAAHAGELWEAAAFLKHFPRGTTQHARLVDRLKLGRAGSKTILECIRLAAPTYATLGQRCEPELADILAEPKDCARGQ